MHPWRIPGWVAGSTLDLLHYVCNPVGEYLAILAVIGGWKLWRGGDGRLLLLLTAPLGVALLAAGLKSYPYGGARLQFYAAPLALLLIGLGIAPVMAWLRQQLRWAPLGLAVLLLCPLGNSAVHWSSPGPDPMPPLSQRRCSPTGVRTKPCCAAPGSLCTTFDTPAGACC